MPQSGDLKGRKRMPEVDFWRGFALVVALIDHAPKSILDFFTPQIFGLSDAVEGLSSYHFRRCLALPPSAISQTIPGYFLYTCF
jgi:uncharacterized membrane protein